MNLPRPTDTFRVVHIDSLLVAAYLKTQRI